MGISTVTSYRNAALFDVIGLSESIVERCFPASTCLLPGLDYADLEARIAEVHHKVFQAPALKPFYPLAIGSQLRDNVITSYSIHYTKLYEATLPCR